LKWEPIGIALDREDEDPSFKPNSDFLFFQIIPRPIAAHRGRAVKRLPFSRHTETAIEILFLTPGSDSFFEFRKPRFLWGGARFGAKVATSDF
jgi:hypothetical protein